MAGFTPRRPGTTTRETLGDDLVAVPTGLRAELLGLAVADPEILVEAIEAVLPDFPGLDLALRRSASMRTPTRVPTRPVLPNSRQLAFLTSRRQVVTVDARGVRYRTPLESLRVRNATNQVKFCQETSLRPTKSNFVKRRRIAFWTRKDSGPRGKAPR